LLLPKPGIDGLGPCAHGGLDYGELEKLGIAPGGILDFSVNSNPFGPPPSVKEALADVTIERYPDSEAIELKRALSLKLGVAPQNLLVGGGSTELLRLVALGYFGCDDLVLIPQPTFGEYEVASRLVGAQVMMQQAEEENKFRLRASETVDLIKRHQPKGIFWANPNNPTGQYFGKREIELILEVAKDSLVILDEAYIAFVAEAWPSLDLIGWGNLVVLRSMTKDYALAGLRLGYAVAAESIIFNLRRVQSPWNVNWAAQRAGLAALAEDGYLEECKVKIEEAKEFLVEELTRLGLSPLPSRANFFLVKVGKAREFRRTLLQRRILVRDCTSFGLPDYIRLAPRTLPECRKLIAAIEDVGVLSKGFGN